MKRGLGYGVVKLDFQEKGNSIAAARPTREMEIITLTTFDGRLLRAHPIFEPSSQSLRFRERDIEYLEWIGGGNS